MLPASIGLKGFTMSPNDAFVDEAVLGNRLRGVRESRGLSLKNVEDASGASITASMLSAYERGEHAITAKRLWILARLYGLSIEHVLKDLEDDPGPIGQDATDLESVPVRFDLLRLQEGRSREARALLHFVRVVESRRRRRTPEWIELRHDDLVTVAATVGRSLDSFLDSLRRTDAMRRPQGRPSGS